jgi:hypothetical protein
MDLKRVVNNVKRTSLTNNTQRVAHKLLSAEGQWLSRSQIAGKGITSVAARIRDLRKNQFGNFRVDCKSATQLGRRASKRGVFYYRINPSTVTKKQVTKVFKIN